MSVTVITPVYNTGKYIVETIESVLNQDYTGRIEYIVLNDGSTDNTLEKLKTYIDKITLVSHANIGEQATVNKGIEMAVHDIVVIVNADDPIEPQLISTAVNLLQSNPQLVAVYPDWRKIDCAGNEIEQIKTPDFNYLMMIEQFYNYLGPGVFFRKSALKNECFRNPLYKYAGDFEFWLRLGLKGTMQRMPRLLASWRHHAESASHQFLNERMAVDRIVVMRNFYSRLDLPLEIREKKCQAFSAAYYQAGILALHNPKIKGRLYLLQSLWYKLYWPRTVVSHQKRNLKYMLYIFLRPLSTLIYSFFLIGDKKLPSSTVEIYKDKYFQKF